MEGNLNNKNINLKFNIMKTILLISAGVMAALWVLYFISAFIYWVEQAIDPDDITKLRFQIGKELFNEKILTWKMFWIYVIRCTKWQLQLLLLITGTPIWGFALYMVIESMIIAGKRLYKWLNWQ